MDEPDFIKGNIDEIEGAFGRKYDKDSLHLRNAFGYDNRNQYLNPIKPIEEPFKAIAAIGSVYEGKLSDKDFVAVAVAGAMTSEAATLDNRFKEAPDDIKPMFTSRIYATGLSDAKISPLVKDKVNIVQFGRESAIQALKTYESGDKRILAHMLGSAIKCMSYNLRNMEKLDYKIIADAEMAGRIFNMMKRDPELCTIAEKQDGLTREHLKDIQYMVQASKVVSNAMKAATKLEQDKKGKIQLSDAERQEVVSHIVLKRVLDESIEQRMKKCNGNPKFQEKINLINEKYTRDINQIDKELRVVMSTNNIDFAKKEELLNKKQELEEYKKYHETVLRDTYSEKNEIMTMSGSQMKTLKNEVKNYIKETGIYKNNIDDLGKEMQSDKFIGKLSAMTTAIQNSKKTKKKAAEKSASKKEIKSNTVKQM